VQHHFTTSISHHADMSSDSIVSSEVTCCMSGGSLTPAAAASLRRVLSFLFPRAIAQGAVWPSKGVLTGAC
jgi:hypothetical protein